MDYEKAYKEALERARKIHEQKVAQPFNIMADVFSELAESDDERIRKELVYFIQKEKEYMESEVKPENSPKLMFLIDALAYLEKQKEPHYSPLCNTIKDKIREYIANNFIADTVVKTDMKSIVKAMEEGVRLGKKEQKPERINITEMVAKYRVTDEYIEGEYKGKPVNCMIRAYEQGIRDTLLKVKEQKPTEWSEEDELRERFRWKPSEEQMTTLIRA